MPAASSRWASAHPAAASAGARFTPTLSTNAPAAMAGTFWVAGAVAALGAAAAAPVPRQASATSAMPANRGRNRGIYPPEQGGGIRQIGAACDLYREHNGSGQASAPTWTSWRPPAVAL